MSFRKTPYDKLVLVERVGTHKEEQGHFLEMVMLMKKYRITGSVYIHSAPIYLTLLIGKVTE